MAEEIELSDLREAMSEPDAVDANDQVQESIKGIEEAQKDLSGNAKEEAIAKFEEAKNTAQKNLSRSILQNISKGKYDTRDINKFLDDFEKTVDSLPVDATVSDYKTAAKSISDKYGNMEKTANTILDTASSSITKWYRGLGGKEITKSGKVADTIDRFNKFAEGDENALQPTDLLDLKKYVSDASKEIDEKNPEIKEKVESEKGGETRWQILKLLLILGAITGGFFLIAHLLQTAFNGCYKNVTGQSSTKLTCGVVEENCQCGDAPKDTFGNDTICVGYEEFPFCKGSCHGNPTCSSAEKLVQNGGVTYVWKDFSPLDAFVEGLNQVAKAVTDDLGLSGFLKYFKYVALGIAAILVIIFIVWIIAEIKSFFPSEHHE